jgi:rhodanese-related sulfurtransferase
MIKLLIHSLKEALYILIVVVPLAFIVNQIRSDGLPLWPMPKPEATPAIIAEEDGALSMKDAVKKFQEKGTLFLDARASEDYHAGHIVGALNLPVHQFDAHFLGVVEQLEASRVIITYCGGKDCTQGRDLALILREMEFKSVYFLVDGWTEWTSQGLPTEKGGLTETSSKSKKL